MIKDIAAFFPGLAKICIVPNAAASAKTGTVAKPHTASKHTGHPSKHLGAVVAHTTKAKPAPKTEKVPKAAMASTTWIPGDYYWGNDDWLWDEGYVVDLPFPDAVWVQGHWSDRIWGWSWVPGYWL